jgi:hypothetical protein
LVYKYFQVGHVVKISPFTRPFFFFIVVTKFNQNIITWFNLGHQLLQATTAHEGGAGFTTFRVIGYGYIGIKKTGYHLSPAGPGFVALVHDRAVATEIHGGDRFWCRLNANFLAQGGSTVKFQGKAVIPGLVGLFPIFDFYDFCVRNAGRAFIDHKRTFHHLSFLGNLPVDKQTAVFSPYRCHTGFFLVSQLDRDQVIAIRNLNGIEKRRLAALLGSGYKIVSMTSVSRIAGGAIQGINLGLALHCHTDSG